MSLALVSVSSDIPWSRRSRLRRAWPVLWALPLLALGWTGCGGPGNETALRLIDRFDPQMVRNGPTSATRPESAGFWNFAKPAESTTKETAATLGWKAGPGVAGLEVANGRLRGRTTTAFPILYAERTQGVDSADLLEAIEVRMRADQGASIMVNTQGQADLNFPRILEQAKQVKEPWPFTAKIEPSNDPQTITLRTSRTVTLSSIRKLLIRPSDVAGAEFEIESVRLISRKEHLARIPSGINWQGLDEIYRESLVSRAPESIVMDVDLPAKAWLDLHLGTVEDMPVTFRVGISERGASEPTTLLDRTITTPHRWEEASLDLAEHAGRSVSLWLTIEAESQGALGFWGGPAIRTRGGASPLANQRPAVELMPGGAAPQGVILVIVDTMRRDHLNLYGYERETAPELTRLAAQGALFRDNISQAAWTKVSVPTILTSLYPTSTRVREVNDRLSAAAVTLPEAYREAGYATVGYSSVMFDGKYTNLHQGYEEFHERGSVDEGGTKTARHYVDRLSDWLERHRDEPFFVLLHVFDPHSPFEPRRPYNALWSDPAQKEQFQEDSERLRKVIENEDNRSRLMPSAEDLRKSGVDAERFMAYNKGWYDGSIRGMDAEMARLVKRLDELGLAGKTLLALTSDHGEEFHEHGNMWHGQTVYGELTQVPLLFHGPGVIPPGLVIDETVQNIDIMPTLLELSHLPVPEQVQGHSLVPLMAAAREAGPGGDLHAAAEKYGWTASPAMSEKARTEVSGGPHPYGTEHYALIDGGWKLMHHIARLDGGPEYELFDHKNDPLNQKNVAAENPEIVKQLAAKLVERREMAQAAALPDAGAAESMSSEELERLKSLGYVQ